MKSGLGRKILLFMLVAALGMGGVIFGLSFGQMRQISSAAESTQTKLGKTSSEKSSLSLLTQAESLLSEMAVSQAENKNQIFERISGEMTMLSQIMESNYSNGIRGELPQRPEDTPNDTAMSRGTIVRGIPEDEEHLDILCRTAALEPSAEALFENEELIRCVLVGTEEGTFYRYSEYSDYDPDYDPRTRDWYIRAMETPDEVVWMEAYVEMYGHQVITCSRTFRDESGELAGVIAMDILIETIVENVLTSPEDGSFSFIIDGNGEFIARPADIPDSYIKDPLNGGNTARYAVICKMLRGESGVSRVVIKRDKEYMAYAPIPETGWSYGIVVPFALVTAPAEETAGEISEISEKSALEMESQISQAVKKYNIICLICALVVCAISAVLTQMITRPIRRLTKGVRQMGSGDLETRIEVRGKDEIAELGNAFNQMSEDLKGYIENLAKATAEKERIDAELSLAKTIQGSMLPSIFPPYPDRHEFDIYAVMNPAREVGGDFYDLFLIDEDHLALTIADVSGKGVPAALFMMISKILLQTQALNGLSPAGVLQAVNRQLCENNTSEMFVTVWFGIYEISTGHLTAANAGHEYPTIYRRGKGFELYKDKHGFVLGGMEGLRYKEYELTLEPGDALFVYTDGVPEATNAEEQLYGTERMLDALNRAMTGENGNSDQAVILSKEILQTDAGSIDEKHIQTAASDRAQPQQETTCEELLRAVWNDVGDFVGEAEQFDDLTMLAVRRIL